MSSKRKSPSINQNWVSDETKTDFKRQDEKTLDECKKYESEYDFKYVQVSSTPKTFKRVKL